MKRIMQTALALILTATAGLSVADTRAAAAGNSVGCHFSVNRPDRYHEGVALLSCKPSRRATVSVWVERRGSDGQWRRIPGSTVKRSLTALPKAEEGNLTISTFQCRHSGFYRTVGKAWVSSGGKYRYFGQRTSGVARLRC